MGWEPAAMASTYSLSWQERRRMRRLVNEAEATIAADAKYFQRFPVRTYRLRLAGPAEVAQCAVLKRVRAFTPHPGWALFALVKQVAPGVRIKAMSALPVEAAGDEYSQELCAELWAD